MAEYSAAYTNRKKTLSAVSTALAAALLFTVLSHFSLAASLGRSVDAVRATVEGPGRTILLLGMYISGLTAEDAVHNAQRGADDPLSGKREKGGLDDTGRNILTFLNALFTCGEKRVFVVFFALFLFFTAAAYGRIEKFSLRTHGNCRSVLSRTGDFISPVLKMLMCRDGIYDNICCPEIISAFGLTGITPLRTAGFFIL